MDMDWLFRLAFILYCITVGVVLCLIPWTQAWGFMVGGLPFPSLRFLEEPAMRGGISGFGLIHLVWGAHDLSELLRPGLNPYKT